MPVEELYRTGTGGKELIVAVAETRNKKKLGMIKIRYRVNFYRGIRQVVFWIRSAVEALALADNLEAMAKEMQKKSSK